MLTLLVTFRLDYRGSAPQWASPHAFIARDEKVRLRASVTEPPSIEQTACKEKAEFQLRTGFPPSARFFDAEANRIPKWELI